MKRLITVPVPQEIVAMVAELDEFKGAWRLYGKLTKDRLKNLEKVALVRSTTACMHADGFHMSDAGARRVLRNQNADQFDVCEEQVAAGYMFVSQEITAHYQQLPFTQATIRQLHRWLGRYQKNTLFGLYKQKPNHVTSFGGDGAIECVLAHTALPYQTEDRMRDLLYDAADISTSGELHPLIALAHFIAQFLSIAPFEEYNHFMAQLLIHLYMQQHGYGYVAYEGINALHEDREQLYALLQRAYAKDSANDFAVNSWLRTFLRLLVQQKRSLEAKIEREQKLSLHVSDYAATLLALIEEHGKLSLSELVQLTGFNKHTTKKYVQELVKKDQIIMHGKARATWYTIL